METGSGSLGFLTPVTGLDTGAGVRLKLRLLLGRPEAQAARVPEEL